MASRVRYYQCKVNALKWTINTVLIMLLVVIAAVTIPFKHVRIKIQQNMCMWCNSLTYSNALQHFVQNHIPILFIESTKTTTMFMTLWRLKTIWLGLIFQTLFLGPRVQYRTKIQFAVSEEKPSFIKCKDRLGIDLMIGKYSLKRLSGVNGFSNFSSNFPTISPSVTSFCLEEFGFRVGMKKITTFWIWREHISHSSKPLLLA